MKLYKEASLMMLPTSVKDGKLYSIFPQPKVIGDNILTEPLDIDTDFNTNGGGVIVDANTFTTAGGSLDGIISAVLVVGKNYKLEIKGTTTSNGFTIGNGTASGNEYGSGFGVHYFTAANASLWIRQNTAGTTDITTFTIKEVDQLPADFDFTRGADRATRVTEQGLVRPVEIVSDELVPSIITTENNNGGVINYISSNIYSSTSDGTSTSSIRPKFDFNTTNGKTYKLIITPTGTITGIINFDFYDGSSYLFQNYDFTTTKEIYFTDNGGVFAAFNGQQTYSIDSFTISVVEVTEATDLPRLDWSGECPSLLLEPQRTNELTQSEYFGADYTLSNTDIINNNTTSPEGLQNATKIYPLSSGNFRHIRYSALSPASGLYTFSIFAKAAELDHLLLIDYDGNGVGVDYNLTTGVATDNASTGFDDIDMIPYGDGWYRCIATATNPYFYWILSDNGGVSVTVNGIDGLYIWGAQAEQGSYPTSYIPTRGQAATRAADTIATKDITNIITGDSFTWFLDLGDWQGSDSNSKELYINSSVNETRIEFRVRTDGYRLYYFGIQGGSQYPFAGSKTANKFCVSYDGQNYRLYIDGVKVKTTSSVGDTGWDEFSNRAGLGTAATLPLKEMTIWNTALSDNECINLTSI